MNQMVAVSVSATQNLRPMSKHGRGPIEDFSPLTNQGDIKEAARARDEMLGWLASKESPQEPVRKSWHQRMAMKARNFKYDLPKPKFQKRHKGARMPTKK